MVVKVTASKIQVVDTSAFAVRAVHIGAEVFDCEVFKDIASIRRQCHAGRLCTAALLGAAVVGKFGVSVAGGGVEAAGKIGVVVAGGDLAVG